MLTDDMLTDEQIKQYRMYGYVVLRGGFPLLSAAPWGFVRSTQNGFHKFGRIYDDLWPLPNLAAVEAPATLPEGQCWEGALLNVIRPLVQPLIGETVYVTLSRLHCTDRVPHSGRWHRDHEDRQATVVQALVCLDGQDEVELVPFWLVPPGVVGTRQRTVHGAKPVLNAGDILLFHPAVVHRGCCPSRRLSWHFRLSATQEAVSAPIAMLRFSVKRVVKRTLASLAYRLLPFRDDHPIFDRFKWLVPRRVA